MAAREGEEVQCALVDREHGRRGAELGRHVGDRRPVGQRQAGGAFTVELEDGAHHAFAAQVLGDGQHQVGGLHARLP